MDSLETFRRLFAYNEWANRRSLDALKGHSLSDTEKSIRAIAHVLIAEKTWLLRMLANADTTRFDFWPEQSLDDCERLFEENAREYALLFADLTDDALDREAVYKNSKGIEYRTSYRDILTHVLFHSAYHRGQAAMAVRASEIAPAYTDYIAFVRERGAMNKDGFDMSRGAT